MSKEIFLGKLFGLRLEVRPSAWITFVLFWGALSVAALYWLDFTPEELIAASLAAAVIHWLSELAHQLGHAWVARQNGYPMIGIRFWGAFSTCLYPDEPELPARIHIRRALGGPVMSFCISILAGLLALWNDPAGGVKFYILLFAFLDNFLVLTLGAFLPLGFTDGSSLLTWVGKR